MRQFLLGKGIVNNGGEGRNCEERFKLFQRKRPCHLKPPCVVSYTILVPQVVFLLKPFIQIPLHFIQYLPRLIVSADIFIGETKKAIRFRLIVPRKITGGFFLWISVFPARGAQSGNASQMGIELRAVIVEIARHFLRHAIHPFPLKTPPASPSLPAVIFGGPVRRGLFRHTELVDTYLLA